MTWSRQRSFIAGLALMALTNAVALTGVAYNRGGEPEAVLRLTQRELQAPYRWYGNRENSGLALKLAWRVRHELPPSGEMPFYLWRYAGTGGVPAWLDRAKMASLGFDPSARLDPGDRVRYEKQLPRDVLLVLELDGPAYRASLDAVTRLVAREETRLAAIPGDKNIQTSVKNAREALEWETARNSRLFAIDAGLDAAALRAKYPDRNRYAIVGGQVRPDSYVIDREKMRGYISMLNIDEINVPFALRGVFDISADGSGRKTGAMPGAGIDPDARAPFETTVAFGKRLEPWIVEAAKK
jgi:hypothetical protein